MRLISALKELFGLSHETATANPVTTATVAPLLDAPMRVKPGPREKCVILVPVSHHIEPACDDALRVLEAMGYVVWRRYGFSAIDQGRCLLAQEALDAGFDEIVWIDADIAFWPYDVDKLRASGNPIVAGTYSVKGWPVLTFEPMDRQTPITFGAGGGLVDARYVATGFLYTKSSVYQSITKDDPDCAEPVLIWGQKMAFPWFYPVLLFPEHDNGPKQYLGEDFAFCWRARNAGYRILLDTTIQLGHIGRHSYSWHFVAGQTPPPTGTFDGSWVYQHPHRGENTHAGSCG